MSDKPFRPLPLVTSENEHYWTGGAAGELRFLRCTSCRHYIHPPSPICPQCLSKELEVEAVSGRAELLTYTVNHQAWLHLTEGDKRADNVLYLEHGKPMRFGKSLEKGIRLVGLTPEVVIDPAGGADPIRVAATEIMRRVDLASE